MVSETDSVSAVSSAPSNNTSEYSSSGNLRGCMYSHDQLLTLAISHSPLCAINALICTIRVAIKFDHKNCLFFPRISVITVVSKYL